MGRSTKIVGCQSAEVKYAGAWSDVPAAESYQGITRVSSTRNASVEFSFEGTDIYWRALHSPQSGQAEIYIDGALRKTVDCYSPRSTSYEQFLYIKKGLSAGRPAHDQGCGHGKEARESNQCCHQPHCL